MRALFIFSLTFFIFFLPASADYVCTTPGLPTISYPTANECTTKCVGGSCDVSSTGSGTTCPPNQFCNPLTSQSFEALVQSLANWVAAIALPIAAIFIIYSGFLFVTAGGNQSKLDAAKTTFYWTIIGTAVVVGAWTLATAIVDFAKKL